ncbi:MAG: DMT family transporter [Alphaproteobacteria bacterium]|nr:DMT family transporter [Alphaproteobacteria bacterium]
MSEPKPVPVTANTPFLSFATAAAVFTILVWGGTPMITKLGVVSIDGLSLALMRTLASAPFALALIIFMGLAMPWRGADKWYLLGLSTFGLIGFPVFFTVGVEMTTAGHAAVVQASTPVFAGLLESAVNRRWPPRRWWIGVSVAFVGAVLLIAEAVGFDSTGATWQGDLLVMAGALSGAVSFVFGAKLAPRFSTPAMTMWSVLVASAIVLPWLVFRVDGPTLAAMELNAWIAVLYLSLGASILAFIAWFYAMNRAGIARITTWHFATPVVGIGLSAAVLGEPLTPLLIVATVVILLGVGLVQRR